MDQIAKKPFAFNCVCFMCISFHVPEVLSRIRKHQDEVREIVSAQNVKFMRNANDYRMLLESAELLEAEIKELVTATSQLRQEVEKSSVAGIDLCQYQRDLEEGVRGYDIAKKLLSIHVLFDKLNAYERNAGNAYEKRAHMLGKIKTLLDKIEDPVLLDLHCYQHLKLRHETEYATLVDDLKQKSTFQNTKSVTIRICKDETEL